MKLRVGIVGCGKIAINHVTALNDLPEVDVVAVCDSDAERAAEFARTFGVRHSYTDLDEFLGSGLDAVTVCTPHPAHELVVLAAARHGLHVLCEKPIAVTLDEADRMIAATDAAGVKFGVLFQRRFWPAAQRITQALADGRLGQPIIGSVVVRLGRDADYYAEPWRGRWDTEAGGALMTQAIHHVDLLSSYMGPAVAVHGRIATLKLGEFIEVEDTAVATIEFASGALASLQVSTTFAPGLGAQILVSDRAGRTASVAEFPEGIPGQNDVWTLPGEEEYRQVYSPEINSDPELAEIHTNLVPFHRLQIEDFVRAVLDDHDPLVTGREARKSLEIILAIYESSRTGDTVRLAAGRTGDTP
jgi:predicted dehydrogenase